MIRKCVSVIFHAMLLVPVGMWLVLLTVILILSGDDFDFRDM